MAGSGREQSRRAPRATSITGLAVALLAAGCAVSRPGWVDRPAGLYRDRGRARVFAVGIAGPRDAREGGQRMNAEKDAKLTIAGVVRTRIRSRLEREGSLTVAGGGEAERRRDDALVETRARALLTACRREASWFDDDSGTLYVLLSAEATPLIEPEPGGRAADTEEVPEWKR